MKPTTPSAPKTVEALANEPGVKLADQTINTQIMVETTEWLYHITVIDPARHEVIVESGDPQLRPLGRLGVSGVLDRSIYDFAGKVFITGWIGQGMRMSFIIGQRRIETRPAVSALVSGPNWRYEVFSQPKSSAKSDEVTPA